MEIQPFDSSLGPMRFIYKDDEMINRSNKTQYIFDIKKYKEIIFRLNETLPIEIVYMIFDRIIENMSFQMFENELNYKASIQPYEPYVCIVYKYNSYSHDINSRQAALSGLLKTQIIEKQSCENEFEIMLKNRNEQFMPGRYRG